MRILLLNYEYPPLGGGAGVATAALARSLAARGNLVDVVTSGAGASSTVDEPPASDAGGEPPSGRLHLHRVESARRGMHQAGLSGAAAYLMRALPVVRRLARARRYDLAHVFFSLPTGALVPFAGLRGVPVVISLRGSDVPGYDPKLALLHRALLPVTRSIWRRADRVVAVCESLRRLARRTLPDLEVTVIRNGVDLELFRPGPPSAAGAPAEGPVRCLAVARLVERKGLADLLVALSLLERGGFRLELVGGGPRERELRELATRLRLDGMVTFAGVLDRASVAERYRAANLFTLAPREEAFGNAFAEALASGLPVVGSRVGGVPELVSEGENGLLVPAGDPAALAAAIHRLAADARLREAMAARNREKAERALSWSAATERYLELYRDLNREAVAGSTSERAA